MKKFRLKLIIGLATLAIFVIAAVLLYSYENRNSSLIIKPSYKASTYIDLNNSSDALMKIKNPKYTSEVVSSSDIIVKGQIISTSSETKSYKLQEGTPEKGLADKRGSGDTYDVTGTNYTIKVVDILKGENVSENIVLYIPDIYKGLIPELNNDDLYVFCLNWNNNFGKYIFGHPSASFYMVDKNDNIKSIYDQTSDFYDLTGKAYEKLKSKFVKEIAAAKK